MLGKYDMVVIQEEASATDDVAMSQPAASSTLEPAVLKLMQLITDPAMMAKALRARNINLEMLPLGSLSAKQRTAGYECLTTLQEIIEKGFDKDDKIIQIRLRAASNDFYTKIPHVFDVTETPPVIDTKARLEEKLDLIESLVNMAAGASTLTALVSKDEAYRKLNCSLTAIDHVGVEFSMLNAYLANTHGTTHTSWGLELEDAFCVEREGEAARFKPFAADSNRQLLWHGSRLTNWCGILKQGLRIAPPEAPVSGYM